MISASYGARLPADLLAQPAPPQACCRTAETVILMQLPAGESTQRRLHTLLGTQAQSPHLPARLGLLDHTGRRRRGLPPGMAARAAPCCTTAISRAAVLTAGNLHPRGDRLRIFVDFPDVEIAVAVAGATRRLGTPGQLHPTADGGEQLRIPDGPALLHLLGATTTTLTAWRRHRTPRTTPPGNPTALTHANIAWTWALPTQVNPLRGRAIVRSASNSGSSSARTRPDPSSRSSLS